MNLQEFLDTRSGGWYTLAPQRLKDCLSHNISGRVLAFNDREAYELIGPRGGVVSMTVQRVSPTTRRRRNAEWKIHLYRNTLEKALEIIQVNKGCGFDKRATAYHEAGHAIAAIAAGIPVVSIEVKKIYDRVLDRKQIGFGRVCYAEEARNTSDRVKAICAIAGPYGKYCLSGDPKDIECESDWPVVFQYTKGDMERLKDVSNSAIQILRENGEALENIAWRLVLYGKLDQLEVKSLMSTVIGELHTRGDHGK